MQLEPKDYAEIRGMAARLGLRRAAAWWVDIRLDREERRTAKKHKGKPIRWVEFQAAHAALTEDKRKDFRKGGAMHGAGHAWRCLSLDFELIIAALQRARSLVEDPPSQAITFEIVARNLSSSSWRWKRKADRIRARRLTASRVRHYIEELRLRFPWFDALLSGDVPKKYKAVEAMLALFRHCSERDAAGELGITPQALQDRLETAKKQFGEAAAARIRAAKGRRPPTWEIPGDWRLDHIKLPSAAFEALRRKAYAPPPIHHEPSKLPGRGDLYPHAAEDEYLRAIYALAACRPESLWKSYRTRGGRKARPPAYDVIERATGAAYHPTVELADVALPRWPQDMSFRARVPERFLERLAKMTGRGRTKNRLFSCTLSATDF